MSTDEMLQELITELRRDALDKDEGHSQNVFLVTRRSKTATDLIESLQGQLTEVIQLALDERAAGNELCDCCKRYARTVTLKTDCLNWRGLQDGEVKQE